jgi:hypothetical protein
MPQAISRRLSPCFDYRGPAPLVERDIATVDDATRALLGAHIRGFITDREIPSIEEARELEDSPWLTVKPGEHERLAPRPKLSREQYQRSDTGRVDEPTVLEAEDNLALRALH